MVGKKSDFMLISLVDASDLIGCGGTLKKSNNQKPGGVRVDFCKEAHGGVRVDFCKEAHGGVHVDFCKEAHEGYT